MLYKKFLQRTSLVCLTILLLFSACKKSGSTSTTVEYQVTATNSSNIAISYNNILGQKVQVNAQTSWSFDITDPQKPFTASVQGSSTSPFSSVQTTCTVNILVNGNVVKTATVSSNTVAVALAEYVVQ